MWCNKMKFVTIQYNTIQYSTTSSLWKLPEHRRWWVTEFEFLFFQLIRPGFVVHRMVAKTKTTALDIIRSEQMNIVDLVVDLLAWVRPSDFKANLRSNGLNNSCWSNFLGFHGILVSLTVEVKSSVHVPWLAMKCLRPKRHIQRSKYRENIPTSHDNLHTGFEYSTKNPHQGYTHTHTNVRTNFISRRVVEG